MENENRPKKSALTIMLGAGFFVILILGYMVNRLWPDMIFNNEPLHSSMEAVGALASILMGILLLQRQILKNEYKLLWMITGLFAIGIFDGFHAAARTGNNFVLLHSLSVFFGGLFFSFMWFSESVMTPVFRKNLLWFSITGTVLLSFFILLFPEVMPVMLFNLEFTKAAVFLNIGGGLFYLAGTAFFLKTFYQTSDKEYFWFSGFSILLGLGGITFLYGDIWTNTWWLWHILRLTAFILILVVVVKNYQLASTERYRIEAQLTKMAQEILDVSTPVMQIWQDVIIAPLIGTLDTRRTQQFTERLLENIAKTNSKVALIDITGVPVIDTKTAQHLIETITAVKLMGARTILTGLNPTIAQTLVHLGVDLSNFITRQSLESGLRTALDILKKEDAVKNNRS